MEGNSIASFENLCKIFEMRIKLDREKGIKTSLDVLDNYEKYSKKIDSIYNSEFQKELKPLISPEVTLEKEEERLKKLIKLLEERLDKRIELEDRFYNSTGKYITGLQIIVSEDELSEKKNRLSLISNYLETSREIDSASDSLLKLKDSLDAEEKKIVEYESKNKIMEDELYSSFVSVIKSNDCYIDIKEEDINDELDEIRGKVRETKETLDITKESVGSLITNGLNEDYTSYIEEAERCYYNYKNKEIVLRIYKLVISFEDDFKLICSKREKINELLGEKKELKNDLSISIEDDLLSFEDTLLKQIKTLDTEREIIENIANYTSRIKFKEERIEELNEINSSAEILVILKEYGLVDTYDSEDIPEEVIDEDLLVEDVNSQTDNEEEVINEMVYNPYRIVEVKDYPKTLNVGLAKLKGESVREKVNKKLNPKDELIASRENDNGIDMSSNVIDFNENEMATNEEIDIVSNEENIEDINKVVIPSVNEEVKTEMPVWELPTEIEATPVTFEDKNDSELPVWEMIQPFFENPESDNKEEVNSIDIASTPSDNSNMFWIPVSDSKLENDTFPKMNIPVNNNLNENGNFSFPTIND